MIIVTVFRQDMRNTPELFNARLKYYPNENGQYEPASLIVFSRKIFNPQGWEEVSDKTDIAEDNIISDTNDDEAKDSNSKERSFARAKSSAYDYLMCNQDCNLFVTLTFNNEVVDRYSYDEVVKKLSVWLDNRVRRQGLKYILIPEHHKDGAIHFHGIANENGLRLVDSGLVRFNKKNYPKDLHPKSPTIYNIDDFPFGFTTCIRANGDDCTVKIARYIFKYMVKSGGKKIGGRYYLHGGKLEKPFCRYFNIGINEFDKLPYDIADGVSFVRYSDEELLTVSSLLKRSGVLEE